MTNGPHDEAARVHDLRPVIREYADADLDAVRTLFVAVNCELAPPHLREAFEAYIGRSLAEEIERIPQYYGERRGSFWIVEANGVIVGMVGIEQVDATTAELRRMYLDRTLRGRGLGRHILKHVESEARRAGYRVMSLSTSELQQAALALYGKSGYRLVREETAADQTNKTVGGGIRRFYFEKNL